MRTELKKVLFYLIFYPTEQMAAIPKLAALGPLFKSSPSPIDLTESETEYHVQCIKHTFQEHIVFQVSIYYTWLRYDVICWSAAMVLWLDCYLHF